MTFVEITCTVDDSYSSLDTEEYDFTTASKKKKMPKEEEKSAKTELWKTLTNSLKSMNSSESSRK